MEEYTKESVLAFLKTQYVMSLASAKDNMPNVAILLYAVDDDLSLYFFTHKNSRKSQNILSNPHVSAYIWKEQKLGVQLDGTVAQVTDETMQAEVMDKLADAATEDEHFWPPIFHIQGGEYIIFKFTPEWLRVLDLEIKTVRSEKQPFTEIKL